MRQVDLLPPGIVEPLFCGTLGDASFRQVAEGRACREGTEVRTLSEREVRSGMRKADTRQIV